MRRADAYSGLLVICAAPTLARDLLAGEHRTAAISVGRLALEEAAVAAALARCVFGELRFVDLARVRLIAERLRGRIGFGDLRCIGESLARQRERRCHTDAGDQKRTTGRFHG